MTAEEIEKAANEFAEKHGFRVPYDGSNEFYDKVDVRASKDGFKAGVEFSDKHWQEKTKSNLAQLFSDAEFIENLCFSYMHNFGLLGVNKQILIRLECKEWLRAIINNWKEIEL